MTVMTKRAPVVRVLLALPDNDVRTRLGSALERPEVDLRVVEPEEALATLAGERFDLIISRWSRTWLKWISSNAPAPAFAHLGTASDSTMLASSARGLAVYACDDADSLNEVIDELARPPRRASRLVPRTAAEVRVGNQALGRLVDCSNDGLAFDVPFSRDPLGLFCDVVLPGIEVWAKDRLVLGPIAVRVTRLTAQPIGYRVGCVFIEPNEASTQPAREVLDATRIKALLSSAITHGAITLTSIEPPHQVAIMRQGQLNRARGELLAEGSAAPLKDLDIVEAALEFGATQYTFTSLLLSATPPRLRVPRSMKAHERRASQRRICAGEGTLRFSHPLLGNTLTLQLADFSPDGLGVELGDAETCLPVGLHLEGAELRMGAQAFRVGVSVRRLTWLDPDRCRVGLKLRFEHQPDELAFGERWLRSEFPLITAGKQCSPATLMTLFERTGIAPAGVDLEAGQLALTRLHQAPDALYRSVTMIEGDEVVGHFGALRRYRHTWTLQHLASVHSDTSTAYALARAQIELAFTAPTLSFVHANYAVGNGWPARVVGSGVSGIEGPERWVLTERSLWSFEGVPAPGAGDGLELGPPLSPAELAAGEAIIADQEPVLLMQANDWQAANWAFGELEEAYREQGLQRSRRAVLARIDDQVAGVLLLELSSIGLNLREDLSTARIWVGRHLDPAKSSRAFLALLSRAGEEYGAAGRARWNLVSSPGADALIGGRALHAPVAFVEAIARRDAVGQLSQLWGEMARFVPQPKPGNR